LSILSRRALARMPMADISGESSMKIGASERTSAALVRLTQSSLLKNPLRRRDESILASEHSRRMESCSRDISMENTATGIFASTATFLAILRASAVFPMLGLPAKMTRSEFWSPDVRLSRRL